MELVLAENEKGSEQGAGSSFKKKAGIALGGVVILIVVIVARSMMFSSMQVTPEPAKDPIQAREGAVATLSEAVRLKTISYQDPGKVDRKPFEEFHALLERTYPNVHSKLEVEKINDLSLLFTWKGKDPALAPVMLMGHIDVVPTDEISRAEWKHPPFSGEVADGFIWGRGTLDDKQAILGQLEAVEALLATGYRPERTIYLAYGHDEEVGGNNGAKKIAELLKQRGVELEVAIDEGLAIVDGIVPGTSVPVGLIGIAEKGFLTLFLEVNSTGGHSSMPPKQTAVGVLARAVARLEDNQVPATISGPVALMFDHLGPEMNPVFRTLFANLWLFGPVIMAQLEAKNSTNATLRTTTAVTMISGSPQDNVLPKQARAAINFRIHPRDSIDSVIAHVEKHKHDDRVKIVREGDGFGSEPSAVSSTESRGYKAIATSVRQVWPDFVVGPSLMVGATDSRHMEAIAKDVYRFSALILENEDTARIHGINERIAIEDYKKSITYYGQLIRNLGAK